MLSLVLSTLMTPQIADAYVPTGAVARDPCFEDEEPYRFRARHMADEEDCIEETGSPIRLQSNHAEGSSTNDPFWLALVDLKLQTFDLFQLVDEGVYDQVVGGFPTNDYADIAILDLNADGFQDVAIAGGGALWMYYGPFDGPAEPGGVIDLGKEMVKLEIVGSKYGDTLYVHGSESWTVSGEGPESVEGLDEF